MPQCAGALIGTQVVGAETETERERETDTETGGCAFAAEIYHAKGYGLLGVKSYGKTYLL